MTVRIYDTPGLQDGFKNEVDYMKDMEKTCKNVDLILYTIKTTETRLDESNLNAMHKFTCAFGAEFWNKVIFVLTFANMVQDPTAMHSSSSSDQYLHEEFLNKKLNMWKRKLPEVLKEMRSKPCLNGDVVRISPVTADRAPVLPAGHPFNPHLPGRKYWITKMWETVFSQLDDEAKVLKLRVNEDRLKPVRKSYQKHFREQPHSQVKGDVVLKKGIGATAGAVLGGALGGPIGAVFGGILGAVIG